jgi:hypothetical protein
VAGSWLESPPARTGTLRVAAPLGDRPCVAARATLKVHERHAMTGHCRVIGPALWTGRSMLVGRRITADGLVTQRVAPGHASVGRGVARRSGIDQRCSQVRQTNRTNPPGALESARTVGAPQPSQCVFRCRRSVPARSGRSSSLRRGNGSTRDTSPTISAPGFCRKSLPRKRGEMRYSLRRAAARRAPARSAGCGPASPSRERPRPRSLERAR